MRILHITLSDPRTHKQGLNRYCFDLMQAQRKSGLKVHVLYPGSEINIPGKRFRHSKTDGVIYWKMNEALPRALMYGVGNPEKYMKKDRISDFLSFAKQINPDIVHVHSIQGFPKECFEAFSICNIPMIFTSHDYYPICPKCSMVNSIGELCTAATDLPVRCAACNYGKELKPIVKAILQSDLYPKIKNTKPVQMLKSLNVSQKSETQKAGRPDIKSEQIVSKVPEYDLLLNYYNDILSMMDAIHFNSDMTATVYRSRANIKNGKVIPISRNDLIFSPHIRQGKTLNVSFLGGYIPNKGIDAFEKAMKILSEKDVVGHVYGYGSAKHPLHAKNIVYHGEFKTKEETNAVWQNTDLLIVPSQWPETFGYVTLEALCRNIPVIVSNLVGSKCLLRGLEPQLVFQYNNPEDLADKVEKMISNVFYDNIVSQLRSNKLWDDMQTHERNIYELYTDCKKQRANTETQST